MTVRAAGIVRERGWNMYLSDIVEWTLTLVVAIVMSVSEPADPPAEEKAPVEATE